jgi:ribonucleotide reductase alpha subunit
VEIVDRRKSSSAFTFLGIKGVAKGVLPVAKALEGGFSYADQLGQRPGAGAAIRPVEIVDRRKSSSAFTFLVSKNSSTS